MAVAIDFRVAVVSIFSVAIDINISVAIDINSAVAVDTHFSVVVDTNFNKLCEVLRLHSCLYIDVYICTSSLAHEDADHVTPRRILPSSERGQ